MSYIYTTMPFYLLMWEALQVDPVDGTTVWLFDTSRGNWMADDIGEEW